VDRRITLLVNPVAGGGRAARVLPEAEAAFTDLNVPFHTESTAGLDHATDLARAAVDAGEAVVTLGGDGLVGCVAGVLREAGGVLGVLPGGRGNDFARALGIPENIRAACAVVVDGQERRLDVGDVDGRAFIGIASCGFDSDANRIANETTVIKGNLVYAYAALRALAAWEPARFELELDGRPVSFSGYSVVCANSRAYGGGMFVAPNAELDDGLLDVVLCGRGTKRRFLYNLPKVFQGRHVESPAIHVERARQVRIRAERPFTVYADGDPIGDLPVTVTAQPRTLRVLVPA
jgi:YegS/Rv2252/BmrU family lipid kinase